MTSISQRVGVLLSAELLAALDEMCPPCPPSFNDSEREIWAKAGERRFIEALHAKFRQANENVLNQEHI